MEAPPDDVKVLIVDDHPIVRQALKRLLADELKEVDFMEAQNSTEALELARGQRFDIVILDITMPGRDGLDVLKELKQYDSNLPVLIFSMHPEDQYAIRALRTGASGYITKGSAPEELVKAIKKILQGGKYVSSLLAERLVSSLGTETEKPSLETLSDREHQVMRMIASGKTVSQIAEELLLSIKTVSTYRTRILEKTGMKTIAELIHYVAKNNLIE